MADPGFPKVGAPTLGGGGVVPTYDFAKSVVDPRGAPGTCRPLAQNILNFMQFFWKICQNRMLAPPRVGAPPTGNP